MKSSRVITGLLIALGSSGCLRAVDYDYEPTCEEKYDLRNDSRNCGACGNDCGGARRCYNGVCECPPETPEFCWYDLDCHDLTTDSDHCGACNNRCGPGHCDNGTCVCDATQCGDACVDTMVDEENCGACGHACNVNHKCVQGVCSPQCVGTATPCEDLPKAECASQAGCSASSACVGSSTCSAQDYDSCGSAISKCGFDTDLQKCVGGSFQCSNVQLYYCSKTEGCKYAVCVGTPKTCDSQDSYSCLQVKGCKLP